MISNTSIMKIREDYISTTSSFNDFVNKLSIESSLEDSPLISKLLVNQKLLEDKIKLLEYQSSSKIAIIEKVASYSSSYE